MSPSPILRHRSEPHTVSQVVNGLASLVDSSFPVLLIVGEISNHTISAAGHAYFSLKDSRSQLSAVMFRRTRRLLRFEPGEGDAVVVRGKLSIYPPRGACQVQVLTMVPQGRGELRVAYEKLREKLGREGLFDQERKRPLPEFPRTIGVVTSPVGAAIKDILQVLQRRFQGLRILLNPVRVQGEGAAAEIAAAIAELSGLAGVEVIIVGRGGGSSEDLWAFNEETVVRAIAASSVPVISAVGHETDWTLSDLAADHRAPTPSAAAELVSGKKVDLLEDFSRALLRAQRALSSCLEASRMRLGLVGSSWVLREPLLMLARRHQRLDEMTSKLFESAAAVAKNRRARLSLAVDRRCFSRPELRFARFRAGVEEALPRLERAAVLGCRQDRQRLEALACRLESVNPLAVLGRGYALVTRVRDRRLLKSSRECRLGEKVRIRLAQGELTAAVEGVFPPEGDFRGN